MSPIRIICALAVLATLLVAAQSASSSPSGKSGCRQVGSISDVYPSRQAWLRLDPSAQSCKCPSVPSCTALSKHQTLFAAESLYSGGGKIEITSTVDGVPPFTCKVPHQASAVLFPKTVGGAQAVVVLKLVGGATTCRVTDGPAGSLHKQKALFVVGNTKIATDGDPVFGFKKTAAGSLVQVRKGTVAVATQGGSKQTSVHPKQQVFVPAGASAPGAPAPLQPDPRLQKDLCALTPNLLETGIVRGSGGNAGSHPQGLAADANGDIWFTDDGTQPAIGRFDVTTGAITETTSGLPPGGIPRWIVADESGTVWFTIDGPKPAIGKIDPRTRAITTFTAGLRAGSVPWAIMIDPVDHRLWFTDQSRTSPAIGSIDPKTGAIAEYSAGLNAGSHPEGIDVDEKGNLWFTDDNDPRPAIGTIDVRSHRIHEYSAGLVAGSLPRGIAAAPDGRLWFADDRTRPPHNSSPHAPGDGLIGVIDPSSRAITEYELVTNGGNAESIPEGLAADARGRIWFTDDGATKAIGTIDPVTGSVTESKTGLSGTSEPVGIVVTPSGLWFTDQHPTPRIGRIKSLPSC